MSFAALIRHSLLGVVFWQLDRRLFTEGVKQVTHYCLPSGRARWRVRLTSEPLRQHLLGLSPLLLSDIAMPWVRPGTFPAHGSKCTALV
jgi:hypothetical protein